MPSRDELEQECEILSAELEVKNRELHQLRAELAAHQGTVVALQLAASAKGVDLPKTDDELALDEVDRTRQAIESDLQAIAELHQPDPDKFDAPKPETTLDVVRHNQLERATLNRAVSDAGQIISRIAAIVRVDRWDHEGTEIREAVQRFEHLHFFIQKQRAEVARDISTTSKHDVAARAELQGWLRALDWCRDKLAMPAATRPQSSIPLTAPDGLRFTQGDGVDTILRKRSDDVLEVVVCRGDTVERRYTISSNQLAVEGYGFSQFIKADMTAEEGPYR